RAELVAEFRVRVAHHGQICRARTRVELGAQRRVERAGLALRGLAVRVVDVAEDDRVGRTRGLTGGDDVAVSNLSIFELGGDARLIDALHAVRALLHHTAAAHGDVGISHQLQAGRIEIRIQHEVEPA